MAHPLDGLIETFKNGDFSKNEQLAESSDFDITQSVRKAWLADILKDKKLPEAGSDEAAFLITLLGTIDKQNLDRQKIELDSKKVEIDEEIKNIMLANPGRLGSAQDIAKRIGGDPDETIIDIPVDKKVFEKFTFIEGEISEIKEQTLTMSDVNKLVKDFKAKQVSSASEGNNTSEEENSNT